MFTIEAFLQFASTSPNGFLSTCAQMEEIFKFVADALVSTENSVASEDVDSVCDLPLPLVSFCLVLLSIF